MAERRTRKQKEKQTQRQDNTTYSFVAAKGKLSKTKAVSYTSSSKVDDDFFGYSLDYIKQDLIKTIIVTLIVLAVLAAIVYADFRFT